MGYKVSKLALGDTQIRPKPGYKPNANTVIYLPLNGDVKDYSGNGRDGTRTGNSEFVTYGDKQVARIYTTSSTRKKVTATLPTLDKFTVNVRTRLNSANTGDWYHTPMLVGYTAGRCLGIWFQNNSGTKRACIGAFGSPENIFNYNWNVSTWYNVVMTRDGGTNKMFINGTLVSTLSATISFSDYTLNIGSGMNSNGIAQDLDVSEVIVEDKVWTTDEIEKYYNDTKRIYNPPIKPWEVNEHTIAYYPLTSTTTVNDMSGNNRNLTNTGATFGTYGGVSCASFSNSNVKGLAGNLPLTGNTAFTFSVWVNRLGYSTGNQSKCQLFMIGPINSSRACFGVAINGYKVNNEYQYWTWGEDINTGSYNTDNQWTLITMTNDTSTKKLYINGTLVKSGSLSFNVSNDTFTIGSFQNAYGSDWQSFYGYMSQFIVEDKEWTADEIEEYYNDTKENYLGKWKPGANTFGYYTFDDQNSSQITDSSGNNRNLTGGTMPGYTLVSGTNYAGNYTTGSGVAPNTSYGAMDTDYTMLVWVKATSSGSCYVNSIRSTSHQIAIIYGYTSGMFEYYDDTGTTRRYTIASGTSLNSWYLVAYTREGTTVKTYLNGTAGGSGTCNVTSSSKNLYLGSSDGGDRFKGQIGECVVESKARTAQEIQDYYNKTKSNYGL